MSDVGRLRRCVTDVSGALLDFRKAINRLIMGIFLHEISSRALWLSVFRSNRQIIIFLLCSVVLCFVTVTESFSAEAFPGARYPSTGDKRGAWSGPGTPYHVRADFDGNGLIDDGWVLILSSYPWRIQMFLAQPSGKPKLDHIEEYRNPGIPPQRVVLSVVEPPLRIVSWHQVKIEGCVPQDPSEYPDSATDCMSLESKETTVNLPALRFCILNAGCATFLWNAQSGIFEKVIPVLPATTVFPDSFVGRRYSHNTSEVLGVIWQGSAGVWTAANGAKYTISHAGLAGEKRIRYLWLDKILTNDSSDFESHEIRFAVPVEPYPTSARYDLGSCLLEWNTNTIVAFVDHLSNGRMSALHAWKLNVDVEKLIPINVKNLDCRDRKW